jgi:hypothetical protein
VNYGRFVGLKEQLGFFEFCYELAERVMSYFLRKCAIFGPNTKFSSSTFFLYSKVLEGFKYAKKEAAKRISKKVLFQVTLFDNLLKNPLD